MEKRGENMAKREVLVYLVLGFLESGKTALITEFLRKAKFNSNERSVIIACEEGIEEYEPDFLKEVNAEIRYLEKEEELTTQLLAECEEKYKPDKVYIEMNGLWQLNLFNEVKLPSNWLGIRNITLVDAGQFELQLANMKEYMMMHFRAADFIIFNRCTDLVKQVSIKRIIKIVNPGTQLVFETVDGKLSIVREEELPFDISGPIVEVCLEDYGTWYVDALENKAHYENKKIKAEGFICYMEPHKCYAFGRCGMTCCAADISFMGFVCVGDHLERIKEQCWGEIIGHLEYIMVQTKEGEKEQIRMVIESFRPTKMPEDNLVYFNY